MIARRTASLATRRGLLSAGSSCLGRPCLICSATTVSSKALQQASIARPQSRGLARSSCSRFHEVQGLQNAPSQKADAAQNAVPGLCIDIDPANLSATTTALDVLLQRVPQRGASQFLFAIDQTSGKRYSLDDELPQTCKCLRFVTFDEDKRAQHAFWWTTAFLAAATLQDSQKKSLQGAVLLASPIQILDGGGFALQFISRRTMENLGRRDDSDLLRECSDIIQQESSRSSQALSELDLTALEKSMAKMAHAEASKARRISTRMVPLAEAKSIFATNPFKLEEIEVLRMTTDSVRIASLGDYVDIVPEDITPVSLLDSFKAIKLQEKSSATWRPVRLTQASIPLDQALVRIRGTSFPTEKRLKEQLAAREDAAKFDHRVIGQEQQLFFTHDSSPGTPFILPNGTRIASKIERVIRDLYRRWGYDEVITPQLFKADLWKRSGHWENYRDDMFAVEGYKELSERSQKHESTHGSCGDSAHAQALAADIGSSVDEATFGLKPMNCPGHCILYAAQEHSYRNLPIRYAEFSALHRNESSGSLSGLTRVRRFHQDDAHVFCRFDQIYGEIESMLKMLREAYKLFGFETFELVLSTRPPQYLGDLQDWNQAEDALRNALDVSGLAWSLNAGDGAFYGPKIDIRLVDASGRRHQTATIQLDFQLPKRFDLKYTQADATDTVRAPVMIHRAILGSMERFMAILIENTRGKWPFWLNPRQAVVLPVNVGNEAQLAYAEQIRDALALGVSKKKKVSSSSHVLVESTHLFDGESDAERERRISHTYHVDVDASNNSLSKRIGRAQRSRVSFICIVGEDELEAGTVSVRYRDRANSESSAKDSVAGATQVSSTTGRPHLSGVMGSYMPDELRNLFITLDDHHW